MPVIFTSESHNILLMLSYNERKNRKKYVSKQYQYQIVTINKYNAFLCIHSKKNHEIPYF